FMWGDEITFGLDTFELGKVKGNQLTFTISDVTDSAIKKTNIENLILRYGQESSQTIKIPQQVIEVFAQYPNEINSLIDLNLPNGGNLEGSEFKLPNDFNAQFENERTKEIDAQLKVSARSYNHILPYYAPKPRAGHVTESLQKIFNNVTSFHVFHDNQGFYGASGFARGMRAINLSNRAFPVVMARSDINKWLPFGEKQAWTREKKPYLPFHPDFKMRPIPVLDKNNTTFNLPFVTAGEIGKGKMVVMGNSLYPSILSCPDAYWASGDLRIDSQKKTCTVNNARGSDTRDDNGNMKQFFDNLFAWFTPDMQKGTVSVAHNIDEGTAALIHTAQGRKYPFFISDEFKFANVQKLSSGAFTGLDPANVQIVILQAYKPTEKADGTTWRFIADLEQPNLTQEDVTALIEYVNKGGNILLMDGIDDATNPEPIGRLVDAAGMSIGDDNVVPTEQSYCAEGYFCQPALPNLHMKGQYDLITLERFPDDNGKPPFTIETSSDGYADIVWNPPTNMPNLEIATYEAPKLDENGKPIANQMQTKYAHIFVKNDEEKAAAIAEIQKYTKMPLCTDPYEYEFNCIEERSGHGFNTRGNYGRKDFDRYEISPDVVASMLKSANLGDNVQRLADHEIYFRTKGKSGARLSLVELNQAYDSLSTWLWNDNPYAYEENIQDELGFKTLVTYLNCYTSDKHDNGPACTPELKKALTDNQMLLQNGELNPSYPLNYTEKPLTRLFLGRSFWDHKITVDTSAYPGKSGGTPTSGTVKIHVGAAKAVTGTAGNMQSTGYWAPQLSDVTVSGGVAAKIKVMLADDLTGKPEHETNLNRPPRMTKSFTHDGNSTTFQVPYGGLIYIQPTVTLDQPQVVNFELSGVEKAALWQDGSWQHSLNESSAPIAEFNSGSFIVTGAKNNFAQTDLEPLADGLNFFAEAASDFYGRDETTPNGQHRRFTYEELKGFQHRFTYDVQISIGAAHSGYPVMTSGFKATGNKLGLDPRDNWLLWHEVGHNLAAAPFSVTGGTEVTNNLLALYMQEMRENNPVMERVQSELPKMPTWLAENNTHAWANGNATSRLAMFAQLKIWASDNFNIDKWYAGSTKPAIYNDDQGWNMFKLMHRKARGDVIGDQGKNYCSKTQTNLKDADLLMVCASYVSGFDLSEFFSTWNPGESSNTLTDGRKVYNGGISSAGKEVLSQLRLAKPTKSPSAISSLK
ncbi:MAG: SslE/AcfD family lipoprotein zinc metalloprotease, partial [Enterovibrio sp.]